MRKRLKSKGMAIATLQTSENLQMRAKKASQAFHTAPPASKVIWHVQIVSSKSEFSIVQLPCLWMITFSAMEFGNGCIIGPLFIIGHHVIFPTTN